MICPSKCTKPTIVPEGQVTNLPKNFAVMEIVHHTKERLNSLVITRPHSNSSQSSHGGSFGSDPGFLEDYKCDVCETVGATVVCPSCAVYLCDSCSTDIHSRKGYRLHQLMTVAEFIQEESHLNGVAHQRSRTDSETSRSSQDASVMGFCEQHTTQALEYLCETCRKRVCVKCQLSREHKDHECRSLVDVAAEKKEILQRTIDEVNTCYMRWNGGFDECQELRESLFDKQRNLEATVRTHFQAMRASLSVREEKLLSQVQHEIESRSAQLRRQAE